ncbi:acyl-CoA thioesterase [Pseudooceanicola nitratireducens]|uniref:acyl-CoA thioesterase n=1 Tax=Pseudooceanicola nitratireducens TaxID=517719 RepID=UPI0023F07FB8|nr:acyl-CoA thioesterase [Pseudooceanicola nitratireducens]
MTQYLDHSPMEGEYLNGRFLSPELVVRPEWIDFNGHLNMAYYGVLFDTGCNHGFTALGFGETYRRDQGLTTMMADLRIRYLRELHEGDRVRCSFRIVKVGSRAFHFCQELIHTDGWVAATAEAVNLHVDIAQRKVVPYGDEKRKLLDDMAKIHADWPLPDWVGADLGVRS